MRVSKAASALPSSSAIWSSSWPRLRRLRQGVLANRMEALILREGWQRRYPELCPVKASLLFGLANLMPAARIMSSEEEQAFRTSDAFPDHYPDPQLYEDKFGEWGMLSGQSVVVDYAVRVHMEEEKIDPRVRTINDGTSGAAVALMPASASLQTLTKLLA